MMMRRRPSRSDTRPARGAASATATVDAVMTRPTAAAEARNPAARRGNKGCGANNVRNAQMPAHTTAAVRVRETVLT